MDRPTLPSTTQTEIQFLLSLLHITAPGQPFFEKQAAAIEQLLPVAGGR